MFVLEDLGIPGPSAIREALTSNDPLNAIKEFQTANAILLPSLQVALPLLDLHSVRRIDFHQSVLDELKERMISRIKEISSSQDKNKHRILGELLTKCFPVITVKQLRPIVMALMQNMPKIKSEYLSAIVSNPELYAEAAVEVKQQIWEGDQPLFGDEVSTLLSRYIDEKEETLFNISKNLPTFFQSTPKVRRQSEVIQELARLIGHNIRLFDMVLQFLRTLFLRTQNVHYCTLRSELLMVLHDKEVNEILQIDPCHKFTWCLDACIREKFVDSKRAKELHGFLDSMRWSQEQVLGDLSMILCDPQAINTICLSIIKNINNCIANETLPRTNEDLYLLTRMLCMGLKAWNMIDSRIFKEPKLDHELITRLMSCIASLIVDDQIVAMTNKQSELDPVPDYVISISLDDELATMLVVHYAMTACKAGQVTSLMRILPILSHCNSAVVHSDPVLHELVSHMTTMADSFAGEEFCVVVFDKFFLPFCARENVVRHLIRLLYWVHKKVFPAALTKLSNILTPISQHNEAVRLPFDTLMEKINSAQQQQLLTEETALIGTPLATPTTPLLFTSPIR